MHRWLRPLTSEVFYSLTFATDAPSPQVLEEVADKMSVSCPLLVRKITENVHFFASFHWFLDYVLRPLNGLSLLW